MELGIDDPEAWLDSISQRVFDVWYAYYQCEPFGSHWEQTASMLSMMSAQQALTAAAVGKKLDAASVVHFMPSDSVPWKKRRSLKSNSSGIKDPKMQQLYLKKAFGF